MRGLSLKTVSSLGTGCLQESSQRAVDELEAEVVPFSVRLGFDQLTTGEVLRELLPPDMDVPSAFETAGHLAHVNLREEQLPFKELIGQVILAKNGHLRTVVNKVGAIDSTFRHFKLEVIAGEEDTLVEVVEGGCRFRFDYARVYWNSRLQAEHGRLVEEFPAGAIVCDMFAGVGPFALPAARRGCRVYANDLNPASVEWLTRNAERNGLEVEIANMDARDFVRDLVAVRRLTPDHFIMNLPASAHEFLDVFAEVATRELVERATVHCYVFCRIPEEDPLDKIDAGLGHAIRRERARVRRIRDVAPNKEMFCVSFRLPDTLPAARGKRSRIE